MSIQEITRVYKDLQVCAEHWHNLLFLNDHAMNYATSRISVTLIKRAKIGFCFGFPESCRDTLLATGVLKHKKTHPIFYGRLVIPIIDAGYVVGFGGRNLRDDGFAKYFNSPESEYYSKSSTLYNLWVARKEINRRGYAILTEGYFDVMGLQEMGLKNACASCGTALTVAQSEKLRFFTESVVVWYDGDSPGREAAKRAKKILGSVGLRAKTFCIAGLDPFDASKKYGKKQILNKIEEGLNG